MVTVTQERSAERHRSPRHPQVSVQVGELLADVDEAIAPLIEALWRLGIRTVHSCQSITRTFNLMREADERFYVMFEEIDDLRRMLGLYTGTPLDPRHLRTTWQLALFTRLDDTTGPAESRDVGLRPVVYVPVRHLEAVTSIARRHVEQLDPLPTTTPDTEWSNHP